MLRMSIAERTQAVGMIRAGTSIRQVAWLFNRRHFSIQSLWAKYVHTGSVEDLIRLPKRRVIIPLQDIQIVNDYLQDRFTEALTTTRNTVGRQNSAIHSQTVRNHLRAVGLRANVLFVNKTCFTLRGSGPMRTVW